MIDLHAHLLPGVDDGAATLAEAAELCRLAAADGTTLLVATPHRRRDEWPDLPAGELRARLAAVERAAGGSPRLALGAELRVDSDLVRDLARRAAGDALTLAGSRALLLEFEPRGIGPEPEGLVVELAARGFRPVVAHPELTRCLADDPDLLARLVERGALLQVTAASVTGDAGRAARARAVELLDRGLVALVASDAHRPSWRPTGLAAARREIARRWGEPRARALTETNPAALLADRPLAAPLGASA